MKHRQVLRRYLIGMFEAQRISELLRDILTLTKDSLIYFAFTYALVNILYFLYYYKYAYLRLNAIKFIKFISLRKILN